MLFGDGGVRPVHSATQPSPPTPIAPEWPCAVVLVADCRHAQPGRLSFAIVQAVQATLIVDCGEEQCVVYYLLFVSGPLPYTMRHATMFGLASLHRISLLEAQS